MILLETNLMSVMGIANNKVLGYLLIRSYLGVIQKLHNSQRGGIEDFVTYRYVYFEGEGRYFMK